MPTGGAPSRGNAVHCDHLGAEGLRHQRQPLADGGLPRLEGEGGEAGDGGQPADVAGHGEHQSEPALAEPRRAVSAQPRGTASSVPGGR